MRTIIFANGPIHDYEFARKALDGGDYFIACDGGLVHAHALGVSLNCVIGDMDSAPPGVLAEYIESGADVLTYPADKDETDLALAMARVFSLGATSVLVLGGLGGRFDHLLVNVHVLVMALEQGVSAEMRDEHTCVLVTKDKCLLQRDGYDTVSLIPLTTEVTGIVTQGLAFPLHGETLRIGTTRGISNRFTDDDAVITVESGILLVICGSGC